MKTRSSDATRTTGACMPLTAISALILAAIVVSASPRCTVRAAVSRAAAASLARARYLRCSAAVKLKRRACKSAAST